MGHLLRPEASADCRLPGCNALYAVPRRSLLSRYLEYFTPEDPTQLTSAEQDSCLPVQDLQMAQDMLNVSTP